MREAEIQAKIKDALCTGPMRVFRNNVGAALLISHKHGFTKQSIISKCIELATKLGAHASRIRFGLHEGSGDLIGYRRVTVTPEMVGREVAVFLSVEVKTSTGRPSEEQVRWLEHIQSVGGIAIIARSPEQATEGVDAAVREMSGSTSTQGESP